MFKVRFAGITIAINVDSGVSRGKLIWGDVFNGSSKDHSFLSSVRKEIESTPGKLGHKVGTIASPQDVIFALKKKGLNYKVLSGGGLLNDAYPALPKGAVH